MQVIVTVNRSTLVKRGRYNEKHLVWELLGGLEEVTIEASRRRVRGGAQILYTIGEERDKAGLSRDCVLRSCDVTEEGEIRLNGVLTPETRASCVRYIRDVAHAPLWVTPPPGVGRVSISSCHVTAPGHGVYAGVLHAYLYRHPEDTYEIRAHLRYNRNDFGYVTWRIATPYVEAHVKCLLHRKQLEAATLLAEVDCLSQWVEKRPPPPEPVLRTAWEYIQDELDTKSDHDAGSDRT